ncbi:MAG: hypothetical protein IKT40_01225 [Bacilli bacterium]|nr:hypothetical protein [Bacilli bacterium]
MWKFIIKQDKLVVAKGFGPEKEIIIRETMHYADLYVEENFNKMTIEIEKDIKHE